eukprot:GHVL01018479.1.p1 GENE.GHVL01018479.1~~GHVL01018479.1.p1  ORF type:complete len:148 (+),score=28.22 GHVL01018479.1:204-647(+)
MFFIMFFRFIIRDFKFDKDAYKNLLDSRTSLESERRRLENFLRKVSEAAFSDSVVAWMHLKAMRVFVEAVLRYGVPPNFASFVLKPTGNTRKLKADFESVLASRGGLKTEKIDSSGPPGGGGPPGGVEEGEYHSYVFIEINTLEVKT